MISREIWKKHALVCFSKTTNSTRSSVKNKVHKHFVIFYIFFGKIFFSQLLLSGHFCSKMFNFVFFSLL